MGRDLVEARLRYESALFAGVVPVATGQSPGEQAERWWQGVERCCEVSRLVHALLADMEVEPGDVILYLGFALGLYKCARRYSGATLRMEAARREAGFAARGLDRRVLGAVSRRVCGLADEQRGGALPSRIVRSD